MASTSEQRWLNGPKLAAWVEARLGAETIAHYPSLVRRIYAWKHGEAASVYSADRMLVQVDLHLSDIPESFYTTASPHRNRSSSSEVRKRALDLYRQGKRPSEIAALVDVAPSTVGKWARAAGLTPGKRGHYIKRGKAA